MSHKVTIIGSGFSGLAAAATLAKEGIDVTVLEKNESCGGRARMFEAEGFKFDMGPSWYWMPDVFEKFYNKFGYTTSDFYELKRLDPSYRVFFPNNQVIDIPSDKNELNQLFEKIEPGSSLHLDKFLKEGKYKYDIGINDLVYKPGKSITEFITPKVIGGVFKLHVFKSFSKYIRKYFKDPRLLQLLEFPVLFLGAKPQDTPALYSLMNYADIELGTWYPMGGMNKIADAFEKIAIEQGVQIKTNFEVSEIAVENKVTTQCISNHMPLQNDAVIASADYHHVETQLIPPALQSYSKKYWDSRTMAPSSLIFYLGLDKKIDGLQHHNLFFDEDFEAHASEIYDSKKWPTAPLFYICCPSKTDHSVAPPNNENLFVLIPVAPDLKDSDAVREHYYGLIVSRLRKNLGIDISSNVIYKRTYAHKDFIKDYNSFKGNAYGLANTLKQTAILKPSIKSKKIKNLFYTGQLTVPGPGVPPSIISGQVAANEVLKYLRNK